jgi:SAM-dependent methyltransferase
MNTFDLYAAYYDLLYQDKNYSHEVNYINSLIAAHGGKSNGSILELGSGTGGHAIHFAQSNCIVHGIDISAEMIQRANKAKKSLSIETAQRLTFDLGDVRTFRANKQFDTVISLFHVMSYQTSNSDLLAAFKTARAHLNLSGLFIFDFWYGPSVLSDRPGTVDKVVENEQLKVFRHTTSNMLINRNCVDVCFDIKIQIKQSKDHSQHITEHHMMRYLFLPEIEHYLSLNNLKIVISQAWLEDDSLSDANWYGCVVAKAI